MIGERFGNYQALSLLGEGGMGSVYLAEHPEIGRRVAVKVLRPELGRDAEVLARFLNEARAANAIRHPNIIEILDTGTTSAGVPYLVMELLEGESLRARLARTSPLPPRDALQIAYQTASALGAAHAKGIVHRDLKPDNLFLVPDEDDPARERVKVLDFGIAKLQVDRASSVRTRTGALMGTPVYMSPEQCLGTKAVDLRTDIYALGIIFFEMLVGEPPYLSEGFGELVNMHLNAPVPSARDRNAAVSDAIASLVTRMLAKRPEDRVSSMADVQKAIKAAAGPTLELRGPSSPHLDPAAPTTARDVVAPTTLSQTAGELARPQPVARSRRGLFAALLCVAAAIGVVGWKTLQRPNGASESATAARKMAAGAPAPPAAPARVELRIDSVPPGAAITSPDGQRLGVTPYATKRAPEAQGELALTIVKPGFDAATIKVPLDRDHATTVDLRPAAPAADAPRKPAPRRPAAPRKPANDSADLSPAKL